VIVDALTKTAHFIAVHTTYWVQQYAELYMDQIVRLHGIPNTIISDKGEFEDSSDETKELPW
jgi:hypothetical protein